MSYVKTLGAVAATGAISVLLLKLLVAAASPILGDVVRRAADGP